MLKAEADQNPSVNLDPMHKQSSPDLAATPLSDPKTSSSKDDTPKEQKENDAIRSVALNGFETVDEKTADADVRPHVDEDSPRTSRQRLTAEQSEAAELLAENALRSAVMEIVADNQGTQKNGNAHPNDKTSMPPALANDDTSPPPPLEKTTQAAWRRMARSYGVKQQQVRVERELMKNQGRRAVRPKTRRGNQTIDETAADIAAFEQWGFAPSLPQENSRARSAGAQQSGVDGQIAFTMPGTFNAWRENADHLLRDEANGYYTGPDPAVTAVAIKRLRKARLNTAEVLSAALHVSSVSLFDSMLELVYSWLCAHSAHRSWHHSKLLQPFSRSTMR